LESFIDILTKVTSVLGSLLVVLGFLGSLTKRGKKVIINWFRKINEPQNKAIICVLRSDVRKMCRNCIKQGYMTDEDLENITEASDAYNGLGGNSYTDGLVRRALLLPIRDIQDDNQ
jgi:hypothetical protein